MLKLIYTPLPSEESARTLSAQLLRERLIACANLLPAVTSWYEWEGKTEQTVEYPLLLKTDQKALTALLLRLDELHPYDVPAILVLPVEETNQTFADWVRNQTQTA